MPGTIALIVAAGRGSRLSREIPKQYIALGGEPILRRTVRAFLGHPAVDDVRCVIHSDDRALYEAATAGLRLLPPVLGRDTRQGSVRAGLESLVSERPDTVLIHDAARPFVTAATITATIDALREHAGAVAAVPVHDSLKRGEDGRIIGQVARDALWRAQTPQTFRFEAILAAHRAAEEAGLTDDAAVAERSGLSIALVSGGEENIKVTTTADLDRAERLLAAGLETRTGFGFDVHRFGPGDHVTLCGVRIDHDRGLVGHSDADAPLHALTDALLGTIGAGDIGQHFPPSDPQWRGADSGIFLRHAAGMIAARGGRIVNVDLTILCERPRIGPHRQAMTARIGELLGLAPDRIGVKATTTETLGFTGRGEGLAAQAVATVRLPA